MTPDLDAYNTLIHLHESPRQMRTLSDVRFRELLNELKETEYKVQPKYEVYFDKPISEKRKYFVLRIKNIAIEYLNAIHLAVKDSPGAKQKTFHVYTALSRTIPSVMMDLHQLIETCNYSESLYQPQNGKIQISVEADEAFVFQYLKHQLVRLYLELSEAYPAYRKNQNLELEDLYYKFFHSVAPQTAVVDGAPEIVLKEPALIESFPDTDNTFRAVIADVHNPPDNLFTYSEIIKKPTVFARVEELLFQNKYITKDYQFINKHGRKGEMAAIYNILIDKGYFNERLFDPIRTIDDTDVVRFLDHRYRISPSLDKQFRNYRKDPQLVNAFLEQHYWTRNILTC